MDVKLDVQTSESNKEPVFGASTQTRNNRKTNKTKMKKKMGEGWTGKFEDRVVSWKGLRLYTQMG